MESEKERKELISKLTEEGYLYQGEESQSWLKFFDRGKISVPIVGSGNYVRYSLVWFLDNQPQSEVIDTFFADSNSLIAFRKTTPFVPDSDQHVEAHFYGPFTHNRFDKCVLFYSKQTAGEEQEKNGQTTLEISTQESVSAYYNSHGNLSTLHFLQNQPMLKVDLVKKRAIGTREDDLSGYVNHDKKYTLGNLSYQFSSSVNETTTQIFDVTGNRLIAQASYPNTILMGNLVDILRSDQKDWLNLLEHLPVLYKSI